MTIIFDWYVSPDEIYTNTELYSYVSPFGGQKKISSGIADVTVEYVTSRTSKYKPHAAIMLATKQISIQWKLQLSVSLMLIHLVIYPMDTAFQLLNNWGLVQELKIFSGYC